MSTTYDPMDHEAGARFVRAYLIERGHEPLAQYVTPNRVGDPALHFKYMYADPTLEQIIAYADAVKAWHQGFRGCFYEDIDPPSMHAQVVFSRQVDRL